MTATSMCGLFGTMLLLLANVQGVSTLVTWLEALDTCHSENQSLWDLQNENLTEVIAATNDSVLDLYPWLSQVIAYSILPNTPSALTDSYRCVALRFKHVLSYGEKYLFTYDLTSANCSVEFRSLCRSDQDDTLLVFAPSPWVKANTTCSLWKPSTYDTLRLVKHGVFASGNWTSKLNNPGTLSNYYWVGMILKISEINIHDYSDLKDHSVTKPVPSKCGYLDAYNVEIRYTECNKERGIRCQNDTYQTQTFFTERESLPNTLPPGPANSLGTAAIVGVVVSSLVVVYCLIVIGVCWYKNKASSPFEFSGKLPTGGNSFTRQKLVHQDTVREERGRPDTLYDIVDLEHQTQNTVRASKEIPDTEYDSIAINRDGLTAAESVKTTAVVLGPVANEFTNSGYIPMDCGGNGTADADYDTLESSFKSGAFLGSCHVYGDESDTAYNVSIHRQSTKKSVNDTYHHLTVDRDSPTPDGKDRDTVSDTVSKEKEATPGNAIQNPIYDTID